MNDNFKNVVVEDMANPPSITLETVEIKCIECGNTFEVSPSEQKFYAFHKYDLPKRCLECRTHKKEVTTLICVDCGKEYTLEHSTINFYKRNNLELPKRCEPCREVKRNRNNNNK